MSTGYEQNVSNGPWVGMAKLDAREWFRDHRGAPLAEFDVWVGKYELAMLMGSGYRGGPLSTQLQEILDDIHLGLTEAVEERRRTRRVA